MTLVTKLRYDWSRSADYAGKKIESAETGGEQTGFGLQA